MLIHIPPDLTKQGLSDGIYTENSYRPKAVSCWIVASPKSTRTVFSPTPQVISKFLLAPDMLKEGMLLRIGIIGTGSLKHGDLAANACNKS